MLFVEMDGSPAVGPRVGLVPATDVFLFDGNPPGGTCGRVSRRSRMEAHLGSYPVFVCSCGKKLVLVKRVRASMADSTKAVVLS